MIEPLSFYSETIPPEEEIPGVVGFVKDQVYKLPHDASGFIVVYSGVLFTPDYKDYMFENKKWEEHFWYDMNEFGGYIEKNFWHIYREHEEKVGEQGGLITEFSHAIFPQGYDNKRKKPLFLYVKSGALVLDRYVKKNFPQHADDVKFLKQDEDFRVVALALLLFSPFIIFSLMALISKL